MKSFRIQFALNLLAAMFALWTFRLHEGRVEASALLLLWLLLPAAAFGLGFLFRKRHVAEAFSVLSAIYCVAYALCCLATNDENNVPLLFVPFLLFMFSCLFVPGLMLYGCIKTRFFNPPVKNQKRPFPVSTVFLCFLIGLFILWLYRDSWTNEREITPLDRVQTIVLKSDRPESGITLRIDGHLSGAASVYLPDFKRSFSLPEDLNKEFCVDSVSGPYSVVYTPVGKPSGTVTLKWDFIYGES